MGAGLACGGEATAEDCCCWVGGGLTADGTVHTLTCEGRETQIETESVAGFAVTLRQLACCHQADQKYAVQLYSPLWAVSVPPHTHHWVKHQACRAGHLNPVRDLALGVKGTHPELGAVSGVRVYAGLGCAAEALGGRLLAAVHHPRAQPTVAGVDVGAAGNTRPV